MKSDTLTAQDTCYIEYLNKDKNFRQDRKEFDSLQKAIEWGKKNLENFHVDMVKMSTNRIKLF